MLIKLADIKHTGKFYKKFVINNRKCMTNFSLMEVEGKWMVGARWRLNYPISTTVGAGLPNYYRPVVA